MIGSYRARVAPFNVSYRYVEEELVYLLTDSKARALVYPAEFAPRVAAIRDRLPHCDVLIQVADESGNDLLPGAVDYETILGHAGARRGHADAVGRRPVHPLHRRHHRHAEGRAVASARHLPVVDGRAPVGQRQAHCVLRRARREGPRVGRARCRS